MGSWAGCFNSENWLIPWIYQPNQLLETIVQINLIFWCLIKIYCANTLTHAAQVGKLCRQIREIWPKISWLLLFYLTDSFNSQKFLSFSRGKNQSVSKVLQKFAWYWVQLGHNTMTMSFLNPSKISSCKMVNFPLRNSK